VVTGNVPHSGTYLLPFALCLLALTFTLGCSTSRREEPLSGPLPLADPNLVAGRQVFMANCYECHPGGSAGLGPSLNDKPLPAFAIRTQVRKGFGAMPAFDDTRIPQPDLDNLVAYLQMLRSHKPAVPALPNPTP
jgi:mono/diheme cytochrome c family protein